MKIPNIEHYEDANYSLGKPAICCLCGAFALKLASGGSFFEVFGVDDFEFLCMCYRGLSPQCDSEFEQLTNMNEDDFEARPGKRW